MRIQGFEVWFWGCRFQGLGFKVLFSLRSGGFMVKLTNGGVMCTGMRPEIGFCGACLERRWQDWRGSWRGWQASN